VALSVCSISSRRKTTGDTCGLSYTVSKPVSRVLCWTVICLGLPLPTGSSHLLGRSGKPRHSKCQSPRGVAPDRVYMTGQSPAGPWALTPRFHPYRDNAAAVSLCCTFPEVAFGGRYPLSLPYGARTFLVHNLSAYTRDCLAYSPSIVAHVKPFVQTESSQGMAKCTPL